MRITEKVLQFPPLGQKGENPGWNLVLAREFHMTNDSHLFETKPGPDRLPLFEGKMIHQFERRSAQPRYWIDHAHARKALLGHEEDRGQELAYQGYRLAFRNVARSTDGRTMIVTMLPRRVFCNHTLPTVLVDRNTGLYCCSVFNSFVFDFLVRQRVATHLTFSILYRLPVPRLSPTDESFQALRDLASRLICISEEFAELEDRAALRAEIDGRVAHLYSLTEKEFAHILSTFPLVPQASKDDALEIYRRLAPKGDTKILALVAAGESDRLEFKSTVRWDMREQRKNPELERVVVRTVAGFLNAGGGTLLLGVADDGTVLGLDVDYQALGKKNRDGYELFLYDLLLRELGKDIARCLRLSFHDHAGADVCRLQIEPSPRAVYLKEGQDEGFYLRTGNSTRRLSTREVVDYAKSHWKS
jgi:Putative DNA-binding domain